MTCAVEDQSAGQSNDYPKYCSATAKDQKESYFFTTHLRPAWWSIRLTAIRHGNLTALRQSYPLAKVPRHGEGRRLRDSRAPATKLGAAREIWGFMIEQPAEKPVHCLRPFGTEIEGDGIPRTCG